MYIISSHLYEAAAEQLKESIGSTDYFSGSITFDFDGIGCRLVASVIVYRAMVSLPDGDCRTISDLVPVWWEFHTEGVDGEFLNDFCFSDLRLYL